MHKVNKIFIQLSTYHDSVVGRIVFVNPITNKAEESNLYSISEINNIIACWKLGELMGIFAIGCILADNAQIELM
jgi:hypothetical protein